MQCKTTLHLWKNTTYSSHLIIWTLFLKEKLTETLPDFEFSLQWFFSFFSPQIYTHPSLCSEATVCLGSHLCLLLCPFSSAHTKDCYHILLCLFWKYYSKMWMKGPAHAFSLGGPASCLDCILCLPRGHEKWLPPGLSEVVRRQTSGLRWATLDSICW